MTYQNLNDKTLTELFEMTGTKDWLQNTNFHAAFEIADRFYAGDQETHWETDLTQAYFWYKSAQQNAPTKLDRDALDLLMKDCVANMSFLEKAKWAWEAAKYDH